MKTSFLTQTNNDRHQCRLSKIAASVFEIDPIDIYTQEPIVRPAFEAFNRLVDPYSYDNLISGKGYLFERERLFILGSLADHWYILSRWRSEGSMERKTFGRACRAIKVLRESDRAISGTAPTLQSHDSFEKYR